VPDGDLSWAAKQVNLRRMGLGGVEVAEMGRCLSLHAATALGRRSQPRSLDEAFQPCRNRGWLAI